MFIEEIIDRLSMLGAVNKYDANVVSSLDQQVNFERTAFTEKQSQLALKLCKRYAAALNSSYDSDITEHLDNPKFRMAIRAPHVANRRITIANDATWEKVIKLEFPYDQAIIDKIRRQRTDGAVCHAIWDKDDRTWTFNLSEASIKLIKEMVNEKDFLLDDEYKKFSDQYNDAVANMEQYLPTLVVEDGIPQYRNASKHIPKLQTTDFLKSVFEARKVGITVWDDTINSVINSDGVNDTTIEFLNSEPGTNFNINSLEIGMNSLENIVKYLEPVIFIIPGGMELSKMHTSYEFLKSVGIQDDEISVMFRLPSSHGRDFNDFVKNNNLNNQLTEKTKAVFVSTKIPKPIFESNIKFNCVVSLGGHNMHYTARDFTKNCPNLVFYCEQKPNKEVRFANL